jgi:hypothetical protein
MTVLPSARKYRALRRSGPHERIPYRRRNTTRPHRHSKDSVAAEDAKQVQQFAFNLAFAKSGTDPTPRKSIGSASNGACCLRNLRAAILGE